MGERRGEKRGRRDDNRGQIYVKCIEVLVNCFSVLSASGLDGVNSSYYQDFSQAHTPHQHLTSFDPSSQSS